MKTDHLSVYNWNTFHAQSYVNAVRLLYWAVQRHDIADVIYYVKWLNYWRDALAQHHPVIGA